MGKGWKVNIWNLHWPGLTQFGDFLGFNQSWCSAESGREVEVMPRERHEVSAPTPGRASVSMSPFSPSFGGMLWFLEIQLIAPLL